ncbi:SCAN domain-containing protein 3 [Trichonephila clavipes]|nr:SCAN domain-containing protein 3 [Trichonephila clavipes]
MCFILTLNDRPGVFEHTFKSSPDLQGESEFQRDNLIKPSISSFLKTVLEKDDKDVKAMPLSKNTVSRRIDEMGEDIEKQVVEKLKTRKFSVQIDESTLRDSEAVLITYVRYIDK